MVFLLTGASHTGKTWMAQKLLEKYQYPYLSIDHLKMGLIRSGQTMLTPQDDAALTTYLWPIVREIIRTVLENKQNLIIEGSYIPFDWEKDFANCCDSIDFCCLIMTPQYISTHFSQLMQHANIIETRLDDSDCTPERLIAENQENLYLCQVYGCRYLLIDSPDFYENLPF